VPVEFCMKSSRSSCELEMSLVRVGGYLMKCFHFKVCLCSAVTDSLWELCHR